MKRVSLPKSKKIGHAVSLIIVISILVGCGGGGGGGGGGSSRTNREDYDPTPPVPNLVTPQGVKLVFRGGEINANDADRALRDVEQRLGYANTDLSTLYVVVEPFIIDERGERYIQPGELCKPPEGFRGCEGLFAPMLRYDWDRAQWVPKFQIIAIHIGDCALVDQPCGAFRFEANRFFKYLNGSPDWNCGEYQKKDEPPKQKSETCFARFVD